MKNCLLLILSFIAIGCAAPKQNMLDEGLTYLEKGDLVKAQALFEQALGENPGDPFILNNLGVVHEQRGNYKRALDMYAAAAGAGLSVAIDSDNAAHKGLTISELAAMNMELVKDLQLATVREDLKRTQGELASSKKTQAAAPQQKTSVDKLEVAEIENTKYSDIKARDEELKSLYKGAYQNFLAYEYDKAMDEFKRFLELVPDNRLADNAQFWIGEIYYAKKDYFKALESFWKVITDYPEGNRVPDTYLRLGDTYKAMNDRQSAARMYKKVLETFPKTESAAEAERRLAGL